MKHAAPRGKHGVSELVIAIITAMLNGMSLQSYTNFRVPEAPNSMAPFNHNAFNLNIMDLESLDLNLV